MSTPFHGPVSGRPVCLALVTLGLGLLTGGCQTTSPAPTASSGVYRVSGIPVAERVSLMHSPRQLKEKFSRPALGFRQKCVWIGHRFEWEVTFQKDEGLIGVTVRHPYPVPPGVGHLTFSLEPGSMADRLSLHLGPDDQGRTVTHEKARLSDYRHRTIDAKHSFKIPMADFRVLSSLGDAEALAAEEEMALPLSQVGCLVMQRHEGPARPMGTPPPSVILRQPQIR